MMLQHPARTACCAAGVLLLAAAAAGAQQQPAGQQCSVCHGHEGRRFAAGVHAGAGIGCADCHGGDPGSLDLEEAHGEGLRTLVHPMESVALCGSCHSDLDQMRRYGLSTDQLSLYWTSAHGKKLRADGDPNVATCADCHGAHDVLRSNDPRSPAHKLRQVETCGRCHADAALMEPYGLSADIVARYRDSVHGRALLEMEYFSSPACADCHGAHGTAPPRVQELGQVCGHCHSVALQNFEDGPHLQAVLDGRMQECTSCHSNHLIERPSTAMFAGEAPGHCGQCHAGADDPGLQAASLLLEGLGGLDASISETERAVHAAAANGLFIEEEHGYLDDARALRMRVRPLTHALSPELLADALNRGHAMIAETRESLAIKERGLRDRKIFTGIFFGLTIILVLMLLAYRLEIAGRWGESREKDDSLDQELDVD